ncbi:uncharacterized protein B0H18DRAFT_322551 [Fomitopsis serialis]|uniref:uncharacterized protein n=1 Tax=Fomitopsis serialis TaxID=139415 RepID=UPI0020081C33|nr:uncharacterized protein B0H18DRAFT_322551 [Neoantrodia serialis]KAH9936405.1 hypothetical protein B0H18DRAFT_322551 [Neoantrodia serialis]
MFCGIRLEKGLEEGGDGFHKYHGSNELAGHATQRCRRNPRRFDHSYLLVRQELPLGGRQRIHVMRSCDTTKEVKAYQHIAHSSEDRAKYQGSVSDSVRRGIYSVLTYASGQQRVGGRSCRSRSMEQTTYQSRRQRWIDSYARKPAYVELTKLAWGLRSFVISFGGDRPYCAIPPWITVMTLAMQLAGDRASISECAEASTTLRLFRPH